MSDTNMKIDNERDRFVHGFDAGQIIDGTVVVLENRILIIDEDGVGYDVTETLKTLNGHQIRLTIVTLEAMTRMESMISGGAENL